MVTRTPPFDVDLLGALLRAPGQAYVSLVERLRRQVAAVCPEAAGQLGTFADRVGDLDEAELEELYRETFGPADAVALRRAADRIGDSGSAAYGPALHEVERLLPVLDSARNPFGPLFKAVAVLLLTVAGNREPGGPR